MVHNFILGIRRVVALVGGNFSDLPGESIDHIVVGVRVDLDSSSTDCSAHISVDFGLLKLFASVRLFVVPIYRISCGGMLSDHTEVVLIPSDFLAPIQVLLFFLHLLPAVVLPVKNLLGLPFKGTLLVNRLDFSRLLVQRCKVNPGRPDQRHLGRVLDVVVRKGTDWSVF